MKFPNCKSVYPSRHTVWQRSYRLYSRLLGTPTNPLYFLGGDQSSAPVFFNLSAATTFSKEQQSSEAAEQQEVITYDSKGTDPPSPNEGGVYTYQQ